MRVFAATLLAMALAASPLLANDAKETGKEYTPVAVSSASAVPEKPAPAVKPEISATETEVQDLRTLVEEQRAELEEQRAALKAEQLKMEALEEKLGATPAEPAPTSAAVSSPISTVTPTSSVAVTARTPAATAMASMSPQKEEESPLYFKIGGAQFYPLGFMDLTNVYRTTTTGTGIGTGFNSVPENNSILGRDSEDRFSAQNSRIGLRTQAKFGQAEVTGYLEADFLGFTPPNIYDTSNSDSLRMRLYWVDYRRGKIEVLGGQSWSLLTPNRNGLSVLPGDLFYSQDVDTNYQLGLTWARQAGVRVILHPNNNWAIGASLENPEQTLVGGVVLPSTVTSTNDGSQFDTNSGSLTGSGVVSNTSVPNLFPDLIVKTAFDANPGDHHVHFDVAGLFRTFKEVNLVASPTSNLTNVNTVSSEIHGGGVAVTAYIEVIKHFNFIGTAFYGSGGGGRYIASTAGPDVIVKPDGTLSAVKSESGIAGFEYTPHPKVTIYGYYSGAYFGKDVDGITSGSTTTYSGYGNPGSSNSANRYMYEPTFGIHFTMWRNPSYGDLRFLTQFSYVSRDPWVVNPPSSLPTAHNSMVFLDLRYDLP